MKFANIAAVTLLATASAKKADKKKEAATPKERVAYNKALVDLQKACPASVQKMITKGVTMVGTANAAFEKKYGGKLPYMSGANFKKYVEDAKKAAKKAKKDKKDKKKDKKDEKKDKKDEKKDAKKDEKKDAKKDEKKDEKKDAKKDEKKDEEKDAKKD